MTTTIASVLVLLGLLVVLVVLLRKLFRTADLVNHCTKWDKWHGVYTPCRYRSDYGRKE